MNLRDTMAFKQLKEEINKMIEGTRSIDHEIVVLYNEMIKEAQKEKH